MASLSECPNCERETKETIDSNYFPVHTCSDCGQKYYDDCSYGDNCPGCGSSSYLDYDMDISFYLSFSNFHYSMHVTGFQCV